LCVMLVFMGRHKHQSVPFVPPTINRPFEQTAETVSFPMQDSTAKTENPIQDSVNQEVATDSAAPVERQKVWVVLEERRVALGALVTVAKGKIVKKASIAEKLKQQGVPLEEKYV